MARPLAISMLLGGLLAVAVAAEKDIATPGPSPWTWKSKLGVFFANTASHNAEDSPDPTISGTTDSVSYKATGEAQVVWKDGLDRVEQRLEAGYGEIRTEEQAEWAENLDSINFQATYERTLVSPQFVYGNGTAETVFTGKDPNNKALDPMLAKLSTGLGHRYENLLPESDALVWRVGVSARKRWESGVPEYVTDVEVSPECYLRYERKQSAEVTYFVQDDGWGDFDDMGHVTNLAQAGLTVRIAKLLTVEVKGRAYYESRPAEADRAAPGYSEWSMRQEAVVGLLWELASP